MTLSLTVKDWNGSHVAELSDVPADTTVGEVVEEVTEAMNLPRHTPYALVDRRARASSRTRSRWPRLASRTARRSRSRPTSAPESAFRRSVGLVTVPSPPEGERVCISGSLTRELMDEDDGVLHHALQLHLRLPHGVSRGRGSGWGGHSPFAKNAG